MSELRIPYEQLIDTFIHILKKYGYSDTKADLCATLFAKASLDGVATHGTDRFPIFLNMIQKGFVKPDKEAEVIESFGFFERWNGNLGTGNINAYECMDRAILLAKKNGIGLIAIQNTNHWMRAGNYGWQAVDEGCIGICFTNTKPNMPAWGGSEPKLGNNPLVIAIPRTKGPIVLDMAMSQYSYGKLSTYLREGKDMPYEAGFDTDGKLIKSPGAILEDEMALPIGLWKGAGLSLVLDILSAFLSGGKATHEFEEEEYGVSQVFLCLYPPKLGMNIWSEEVLDKIIDDLESSSVYEGKQVRYPGKNILQIRSENLEKGVPVAQEIWDIIQKELK